MIKFLKIACLLVLVVACKDNKLSTPEKPKDLISKAEMVDILYDMSILSAGKGADRRTFEAKGIMPQEYIYNKYNIDSLQFAESNNYYSYNVSVYEDLYEQVQAKLVEDKRIFKEDRDKEKTYRDSIKQVKNKRIDSLRKLGQDKFGKQIKNVKVDFDSVNPVKKADSSQISTHQ